MQTLHLSVHTPTISLTSVVSNSRMNGCARVIIRVPGGHFNFALISGFGAMPQV